ncbi:hypothetical protein LCGC14_2780310, partial [marine sediment metagenome]
DLNRFAVRTKPNIVYILADDLGYGDISSLNPDSKIKTPNVDRMAASGMRFTDAHSGSAVCTPTRYGVLTGRYAFRSELKRGVLKGYSKPLIPTYRATVASFLKQQDYNTACIGKWHLGWDWPIGADDRPFLVPNTKPDTVADDRHRAAWQRVFSQPIAGGPTARGFDHYFGTDVPNWPPFCFIEDDRTVGIPSEFLPARLLGNNQASVQGPALKDWTLEPILPALGDRAVRFIRDASRDSQPYFLYMPLTAPHTPLAVNRKWQGASGLNTYADFVMETDAVVGRVLETIDNSGTAERTLVLFTSDNGYNMGHHGITGKGNGTYPMNMYEESVKVPFIANCPGRIPAGVVNADLVSHYDFMPTILDCVGLENPEADKLPGRSFAPLLKGERLAARDTVVVYDEYGPVRMIRDERW